MIKFRKRNQSQISEKKQKCMKLVLLVKHPCSAKGILSAIKNKNNKYGLFEYTRNEKTFKNY